MYLHLQDLMETLQNSIDGKISKVIPADRLEDKLKYIQLNMGMDKKLPVDIERESVYHLYKIVSIKVTLINEKILIELNIPVVERENYTSFICKAIPTPTIFFIFKCHNY